MFLSVSVWVCIIKLILGNFYIFMSHCVLLIASKQGIPPWWNETLGAVWFKGFPSWLAISIWILLHRDFAPLISSPTTAKPEEISICRCWDSAVMRFEGHQSASSLRRINRRCDEKYTPEMQMSHCDDEHESASSGAWYKGMRQVWTAEKFGKWVNRYVSKIRC